MAGRIFRNDRSRSDFLYQISTLLEEGYSLSEAIQLYMEFTEGKKKEWVLSIYEALLAGDSFSDQLIHAGYPKELISYLSFIERYSDFQKGLSQASIILKKRFELQEKIKKILHYPSFLFLGLLGMAVIMVEGVLPQFDDFFQSMGQELPWITRAMLSFAQWFQLSTLLIVFIIMMLCLFWFKRKPIFEQVYFLLKVPIANIYLKHLLTYYFTSQIAPLLKNGFSLYDTLKIIEHDSLLVFFQREAKSLAFGLQAGNSLGDLMKERSYYLPQLSSVILLGDSKGNLGVELERFSNFLFYQMYDKTYRTIRFIQPMFFCTIGIFILVLFLSMMLPIFSILDGW